MSIIQNDRPQATEGFGLSPRLISWVAAVAGLLYIAMCTVFYQERTLLLDIAFQTVMMIQNGTLEIQVNRFGSGLIHVLPLMAIQLKWSLATVLILYSLSFPLVYAGFFLLITKVFRQWDLGIALLLLYTLVTFNGFYWATSELQQGLGFLLVVLAGLIRYHHKAREWAYWLFMVPAMITLIFYHPLLPLVFGWAWVYLWMRLPALRNRRFIDVLLLTGVLMICKSAWFTNWYDTMKFSGMLGTLKEYGMGFMKMPAHLLFLDFSWRVLYGFWIFLFIVSAHYIRRRKFLPLAWMWLASLGWILLANFGNATFVYPFYQEVSYMPLALFVAIPFVKEVLPTWPSRLASGFLILVLAERLFVITYHHSIFTARLGWLDRQIENCASTGSDRCWINDEAVPMDTVLMTWGVTYETLLRSSLRGPEQAKSISVVIDPQAKAGELADPNLVVGDFINHPIPALDTTYFRLSAGATQALK